MKSLNRKIKALLVLFSFAAYMPVSTMPSFADVTTDLQLNGSINGGYVGWNDKDANKYDVNIKGGPDTVAQFDWGKFNVGSKTTVDWIFSAGNQTAINRVLNSGGMSYIYGKLTNSCSATGCNHEKSGNVILINPNGIMFGNGSQVNLNSFTASTRDLTNAKNVLDAAKDGYFGKSLKADGNKNYVFADTDALTQHFKYGNVLNYDVANNTIAGDGNGTIGGISVEGADFNGGYTADGQPTTQATNISLIANNIYVKDSNLQTYVPNKDANGNFSTAGNSGLGISRSGVKLITADGVNFTYGPIGEVKAASVSKRVAANKTGVQGININNSNIWTGDAKITNASNTYLIVKDSKVLGSKVADNLEGHIVIESDGTVNILESRVETLDAGVDETSNINGLRYGDIDIIGGYDVVIRNSKIASADSGINLIRHDKNAPAADKKLTEGYYDKDDNFVQHNVGDVGNINITAGNKVNIIANDRNANKQLKNPTDKLDVTAGGNLKIAAGDDVVITSTVNGKTNAKFGTEIRGKNIEVTGAQVMGADVKIVAADVDKKNVQRYDANGNQVGSIVIKDAVVDAHGYDDQGTRSLEILGLDTTIIDTLVEFDTLAFHNDALNNNNNLNRVALTNGTTILDRDSNDLVLESNGMLIIDKNNLLSKGYDDTAAVDQKGNITLRSTQELVSIRNNSNINTTGDILIDAATSAAVANSTLTTTGDITINANTAVAIGDSITDVAGTHTAANVNKTGSTLNAKNINITAQGVAETPNGIKGVRVKNSKLNASGENTTLAVNGLIEVMDNGEIKAANDNKLTANNGKVTVDATSKVKSTAKDVIITQSETANLDNDVQGKVTANAGNIKVNVTGAGKNINASHLNNFEYGKRLALDAENNINLSGNSWNLNKVDFNAKNNNVTATTGNVIVDDITLGNKTNKTTIQAKQNVKTQNGIINANGKKLTVNAEEDIDIAFKGVNNTAAGLEINVDANTAGTHAKNQQLNNASIARRNVKLTAQDGQMAIAKVKANTLETNGQLVAATDGKIDFSKDNIYSGNKNAQNVSDAYIEVKAENGWTRNEEVDYSNALPVPGIYKDHYDVDKNITVEGNIQKDESTAQRHKINDGAGDILLVYTRMSGCGETIIPDKPTPIIPDVTPQVNVDNGLTETTVVRLPRHEEGVSAIAPVLNEITDPTANVIMAAASLTLDDENEAGEDEF